MECYMERVGQPNWAREKKKAQSGNTDWGHSKAGEKYREERRRNVAQFIQTRLAELWESEERAWMLPGSAFLSFTNPLHQEQKRDTVKKKKKVCFFLNVISIFCPPVSKFRDKTADDTQTRAAASQHIHSCSHAATAVARYWGYKFSSLLFGELSPL